MDRARLRTLTDRERADFAGRHPRSAAAYADAARHHEVFESALRSLT
jgi:hypothetical protein